ncbi:hypothetical protein PsorP6_015837 [Peronosclerospora sorghi]|uniref:Uncharacterized protein n=1 Tax=Peronosclerospora sorghi TaxID=230839 RepID=A0ACC0WQC7_9STRA|nr:hypothetical protein PsorP6_015837 [Peronosclerospora sorghi]
MNKGRVMTDVMPETSSTSATYEAAAIAGNRLINMILSLFKLIVISILAMNMKDKLLSLID